MSEGQEGQHLTGAYPSSGLSHEPESGADPFGPDTSEDVYTDPFSSGHTAPLASSADEPVSSPDAGLFDGGSDHAAEAFTSAPTHPETYATGFPAVSRSQIQDERLADILGRPDDSRHYRGNEDNPLSSDTHTGSRAYTGDGVQPEADVNTLGAATQGSGIQDADRIAASRTAPQDVFRNTQDLSGPYPASDLPPQQDGAIAHASYPSAEAPTAKPSPQRRGLGLRRMMRSENLPTAPMRVVERLANSPFANPRRHKENTEARKTLNFSLRMAETMFHFGADSRDVETAIVATCATYGVEDVDVDITNQSVIINYISEYGMHQDSGQPVGETAGVFSHTVVRVVRSWSDNYAGLTETHRLVKTITNGELSRSEAEARLNRILSKPKPFPRWLVSLCNSSAAAALTIGIGGTWPGAIVSFLTFALVQVMAGKLASWRIPSFFTMAACSALVTLIAMVLWAIGAPISPPHIIGSGLIMLLPTLTLVSTIQDAINGFPVTSAGRLISTGLSFLGLIVGIAIAISITTYIGFDEIKVDSVIFSGAQPLVNIIFMLIATALIAVTVQVKPEHILLGVFSAFCGLLVYHLFGWLGAGSRMISMLGAVGVGCASALIAQRRVVPQVVIAVPALTFLLPGLTIFRGMYTLTVNIDPVTGIIPMLNAGAIIMSMAAAVVLGNYLMRPFMSKDPQTQRKLVKRRKQQPEPLGN
ncbi:MULTISPECIES: threonine/serine exporter family protein [Micrococcaceae]|uniref:threonine/serine ThrE exporter family protein n=1 Tax=unclassified Kocuria TaxID=2649579 RepID=UPI001012A1CF|nr:MULTISPECIES: threonine/serine exporter family protein [unclassified Kocuria]